MSTDVKLGADELELLPDMPLPEAPEELLPEAPVLDDPLVALGLEDELPLAPELLDLSPAAQAWAAKPTNAAVTAALMSFNVIYVSLRG